jgi:hypothetical protein
MATSKASAIWAKKKDFQDPPLPMAQVMDCPASKSLSPSTILKNRYIGKFMYMTFCIVYCVICILYSVFCIPYSVFCTVCCEFACMSFAASVYVMGLSNFLLPQYLLCNRYHIFIPHTATKIPNMYSFSWNSAASAPISCVCERFILSQDWSTYFLQQNRDTYRGNI